MTTAARPFGPAPIILSAATPRCMARHFRVFASAILRRFEFEEGISPAWPVRYAELEPYYAQAEASVLGAWRRPAKTDASRARSAPYPFPNVCRTSRMPPISMARLRAQGFHPFSLPLGSICARAAPASAARPAMAFPCKLHAKGRCRSVFGAARADIAQCRTADAHAGALRLLTDASGRRITGVEVEQRR